MKQELIDWGKKVSESKQGTDKRMFDDLMRVVIHRLDDGIEDVSDYLKKNLSGKSSRMRGPHLLGTNSEIIFQKFRSLNLKKKRCHSQ